MRQLRYVTLKPPSRCSGVIGFIPDSRDHSLAWRATNTAPPADILQSCDNSARPAEHHCRLIYEYTTWVGALPNSNTWRRMGNDTTQQVALRGEVRSNSSKAEHTRRQNIDLTPGNWPLNSDGALVYIWHILAAGNSLVDHRHGRSDYPARRR